MESCGTENQCIKRISLQTLFLLKINTFLSMSLDMSGSIKTGSGSDCEALLAGLLNIPINLIKISSLITLLNNKHPF